MEASNVSGDGPQRGLGRNPTGGQGRKLTGVWGGAPTGIWGRSPQLCTCDEADRGLGAEPQASFLGRAAPGPGAEPLAIASYAVFALEGSILYDNTTYYKNIHSTENS